MNLENISSIEMLDSKELIVVIESGGKPSYQFIYREAAEVNWDNQLKAFKSPVPRKWSHSDWFNHIVKVAKNCGISLVLKDTTGWVNISTETKAEICVNQNKLN